MLASHWMKAAAVFLYIIATAWVLTQCDRLMEPAPNHKTPTAKHDARKDVASAALSEPARLRDIKRRAHDEAVAKRRARYRALEADLLEMIKTDLPAALAELAHAAIRYRNKLSDLKHLTKAEQWERETPVKEAHARVRSLTEEWYKVDLEAQKEREGPTLNSATDMEALTKRLAAFKRGGEEIGAFAASLASLHGKVPEGLLLSAIDAIPRAVLPKDYLDPCRDPQASTLSEACARGSKRSFSTFAGVHGAAEEAPWTRLLPRRCSAAPSRISQPCTSQRPFTLCEASCLFAPRQMRDRHRHHCSPSPAGGYHQLV
jgi:hypothetical protein